MSGLCEVDQKLLARDVARRIKEHTRSRASTPAGWQRWADDILEPVIDWRRMLRAAVRHGVADIAGRVDFTYRRPSRRAAALPDVVLPSLRQPLPTVAVVIDTSGSMSDGMLSQILGEVAGLLTSVGVGRNRLHVVCCDAKAYQAQRVLNAREVRLLGGGGTDMGAGLAATDEPQTAPRPGDRAHRRPHTVAARTTRQGEGPGRPDGSGRDRVPDWATSVAIDPETVGSGR